MAAPSRPRSGGFEIAPPAPEIAAWVRFRWVTLLSSDQLSLHGQVNSLSGCPTMPSRSNWVNASLSSTGPKHPRSTFNGLLLGLLAAQLILLALLAASRFDGGNQRPDPIDPPAVGEVLQPFRSIQTNGDTSHFDLLGPGGRSAPLVLFAFSADCVHCDTVAPIWKEWVARSPSVTVVGITDNTREIAEAYVEHHGWRIPAVILPEASRTNIERYLLSRTPWIFVVSTRGELLYQGHGADVEGLDAGLARAVTP